MSIYTSIIQSLDHCIGFDLDQPVGVDKARDLHDRVGRANLAEKFAMRLPDTLPVVYARQQDARAYDIMQARSRLLKRGAYDLDTAASLSRRVPCAHRFPVRPDWRCSGHRDNIPHSHGA